MNAYPKRVVKSAGFKNISDSSIKLSRWLLLSIGAWPQTSTVKKIFVSIQIFINVGSLAIIFIPCMLYVLFDDELIQIRIGAIVSMYYMILSLTVYWVIIRREKDIYNCMRHMETDWKLIQRTNDRKVMFQFDKIGSGLVKLFATILHCGATLFIIARAAKTTTFTIGNETFTTHPMSCPVYQKIIDVRFSPANEIFLGFEMYSSIVSNSIAVTAFSILSVFAMHACGQLHILCRWLNEVTQNHEQNLTEGKIAVIVEHHLRIFSMIKNLESIMNPICLLVVAACTLDMCFIGYYAIVNWEAFDAAKMFSYVLVYASSFYNIFVFCYVSEKLTEQCKKVGEVAYMSDWYKLPHATARSFVLIILRSNQTIKITGGKIFQLSIGTFGDVVKTSMVYLNLLRAMIA